MNISFLKPFWHLVSNRHVEEDMDELLIIKVQLVNRYVFLVSFVLLMDATRNLFLGHSINSLVLFTIGCLLCLSSWYTKLYFNKTLSTLGLIGITLLLFYFCSFAGFYNGIAPYYFVILFAALFIFSEKNKLYNIFVFLWVFILFYMVQFLELEWWSDANWIHQFCFHEDQHTTLLQYLFLLMINGYFIMLKNSEMQQLYHQVLQSAPQSTSPVMAPAHTAVPSVSVEELLKLARNSDSVFMATFQQAYPGFYSNLYEQNPDMTPGEFKLCTLLKLGFTTKDIANYDHLAVRTVQTKKNRLRKSFSLRPQEDLYIWVTKF